MVGRVAPWAEHAIWWHVYPLGFTGAEREALPAVTHRLPHLASWLDYAVDLGCNGLLLGPVFAAETHGYDTVDHFRIDPRLGDDEDFDALVAAARARGVRIVLDGVFNHVGRGFPAFAAASAALAADADGPGTPAVSWFRRSPGAAEFEVFEGHSQLVELNHDEPAVIGYVAEVMRYWLARGASGWRLDAAYAVPPEFWARVLPAVRAAFPEAWFLGEMIHGDYAGYAAAAGLDSITQYETWKAIWSSLRERNFWELDHALGRHNAFLDAPSSPPAWLPQVFVGNHDVTRLATAIGDPALVGHALAVLFTLPGVPSVYYGDEQAFRGVKEHRAGGDDEIRPAFPASPAGLAPYGWPVYRLHQRLIGFRRRHPWLVRARTATGHLSSTAMAVRVFGTGPSEQVVVLLNSGDEPVKFPVPPAGAHEDLEVAEVPDPGDPPADPLLVPPRSWTILA